MGTPVKFFSPAKVNLSLNIGDVRADGFHNVDSVFHLLTFGDILTVESSEALSVTTSVDLGIDQEQNLAYKAALAMAHAFGISASFAIHIEKNIPHGGGLGGGSSNAATVIYALATINAINPYSAECAVVARELGADVAVFLAQTPAVVMSGRGDEIVRELSPAAGLPVVVVIPKDISVSTAEVYKEFDKAPRPCREQGTLIKAIEDMDVAQLSAETYNNLGPAAIHVCPQIGELLRLLRSQEAVYSAQVSGSGAACFAICRSDEDAAEVTRVCTQAGYSGFKTELATRGVRALS